ncbi:NUDIX domain-containing protein [Patescibacteria group bacterium]|nr:NUDIX domain-containing protein [Patescibacteria group bacterium]MBU1673393.1 NUDIX domain-containing protein [Patescibacteria group bacterium]MBU1963281.1 NUDIX domain-containing protein [Patescibacteria group bacterium]
MGYHLNITSDDQKFKIIGLALAEIDNKIVLIQDARERSYGRWGLPGGALRHNETVEDAVLRGLKEDTGLEGEADSIIGIHHWYYPEVGYGLIYKILAVKNIKGDLKPASKDVLTAKLYDAHDIFKMPDESCRHKELKQVVKDWRRGKRYPLDIINYL